MNVTILGTGTMAAALAESWRDAGHSVTVAGRSAQRATELGKRLGLRTATPRDALADADVAVLAVAWEGVDEMLDLAGAREGAFADRTLIDVTNAVDYETGILKPATGSAAEHISDIAKGAQVVKALHLYAGMSWLEPAPATPHVVAMVGDDDIAISKASTLVRDLGGVPAVLGGLDRARQLEDVAGFVVRLVGLGFDPSTAIPSVPQS
jgi:predicted dinucleotide-binding enzyme